MLHDLPTSTSCNVPYSCYRCLSICREMKLTNHSEMKKKKKKRRLYPIALILLQFHANVTALVAGFLTLQFMTPGLQALEWGQREPFLFLSLSISFKQQFLKSFSYLKGNFAAKKSKSICSFIIRHIFSEASGGPAYTYKSSASQWVRKKKKRHEKTGIMGFRRQENPQSLTRLNTEGRKWKSAKRSGWSGTNTCLQLFALNLI